MKKSILKTLMIPFALISAIVCALAFICIYPFFLTVVWFIGGIKSDK